jgi:hypothetical protein
LRAQAAADGGVGGPGPAIALALQPAAETGLRLARTLAVPRSPQVQVAVVARQVDARGAHAGIDHTGAAVVELYLEVALGALKRCAKPHRRSHREIPLAGEHHVLGQVVLRQGQAGQPVDPAQGQSLNTALRTPLGGRCVAPAPAGRLPLDAGLARLGPGQPKIASRHLQRARQGRVLPVHGHALAQPQGPGAGLQAVLGCELQRLDLRAPGPVAQVPGLGGGCQFEAPRAGLRATAGVQAQRRQRSRQIELSVGDLPDLRRCGAGRAEIQARHCQLGLHLELASLLFPAPPSRSRSGRRIPARCPAPIAWACPANWPASVRPGLRR